MTSYHLRQKAMIGLVKASFITALAWKKETKQTQDKRKLLIWNMIKIK